MEKRSADQPGPELRRYAPTATLPKVDEPGDHSRYQRSYFRSCRYFTVGHEWFAATREGGHVGPCFSLQDLELHLAHHLTLRLGDACDFYRELPREGDPDATTFKALLYELCTCRAEAAARSEMGFYAWVTQRLAQLESEGMGVPYAAERARALRFRLEEFDRD
ncbi:MAG: DUF6316 family protein [Pseudomonadota bacterium]